VNFCNLNVREFGTVYAGLLENDLSTVETDLTTEFKDSREMYSSRAQAVLA